MSEWTIQHSAFKIFWMHGRMLPLFNWPLMVGIAQLVLRDSIKQFQQSEFSDSLTLSLPSLKSTFSQPFKEKCISEVVRISSVIIFHLSKLWKSKFFIRAIVFSSVVRLQGKFEIGHSWEWKDKGPTSNTVLCVRATCGNHFRYTHSLRSWRSQPM